MNWVKKIDGTWGYVLLHARCFDVEGLGLDGYDFKDLKGNLLARCVDGVIAIYYMSGASRFMDFSAFTKTSTQWLYYLKAVI